MALANRAYVPATNTKLNRCTSSLPSPASRHPQHRVANIKFAAVPESALASGALAGVSTPVLLAGGAAVAGILGAAAWAMRQQQGANAPAAANASSLAEASSPPLPERKNAVLVLGASGRVGRRVVQRLLQAGRTVVAAARTAETAEQVLTKEMGLQVGQQADGSGVLFLEGVDVRSLESLRNQQLWQGVTQVLLVLSGKAGMRPDGQFGYFDGLTPEDVEANGIKNVLSVLPEFLSKDGQVQFKTILPMGSEEEVAQWSRMDDVIMGGQSSSGMTAAPDVGPAVARWTGDLIVEGGGFCGTRTKLASPLNLTAYDGVALRVKGDGSTFKMNIKTMDQMNQPEYTYQATFDTVAGQWADVCLPWHHFVPVKKAYSLPQAAPLDPKNIAQFALVYSRFEFNDMPNAAYKPGKFELLLDGGVRAFKAPRPQVVQLSSAGVERNALIGDDAEARKQDVPIVQLNPGGVLNHKYAAEVAIRSSGWPYTIVRSTGMIDSNENGPFKLEVDQGDSISGSIGRDDTADVLTVVLNSSEAAFKTFELRRSEALDARGRAMSSADYRRMLLKLATDRQRVRLGLRPFPKCVPPPAPVTEDRVAEIKQNIVEIRTKFKASGMGVQEEPTSQQQQRPAGEEESRAEVGEKEVVSAGTGRR